MSKLDEIVNAAEGLKSDCGHSEHNLHNEVALLIRAVRQLGASHVANMKHSEHAGYATKCGVCKAAVEINPDVLDLIMPPKEE